MTATPSFILRVLVLCLVWLSPARAQSVARTWNEEILSAIRIDLPNPPVHARNLFHLAVCMYDAWAAYDTNAVGVVYHAKHTAPDIAAARHQAISHAAHRILQERYALSVNAALTQFQLQQRLQFLGYNPGFTSVSTTTAAGVGNAVAAAVSAYYLQDGANQTGGYADATPAQGGYVYVNPTLVVTNPVISVSDVNLWQRLRIQVALAQNGLPVDSLQTYVGARWLNVRPFSLHRDQPGVPWIDPGPPPRLGTASDAAFRSNVVAVIRAASELTASDGVMIDISPGAWGDNTLGTNDGNGHDLNPATGQPYAANPVKRGDFVRVLAEYWADGPTSETPPGHWNSIANAVVSHPSFQRRIGGTGPVLDPLEWDVKMYMALNGALHNAACAAWGVKRYYNGWRPISAVRWMAQNGQSSDPLGPSYHPNGLPLIPDLIEVVTAQSGAAGQRHAGIPVGMVALRVWPGQPPDPETQTSGVRWVRGSTFHPYQRDTFVTPAFPGYVSGHSTFSRAAAEVLTAMTGSPYFPGGFGQYSVPANTFLVFERGPSQALQLQWGTYFDAADQAGLSRIWGGIHPPADDFGGRIIGAIAGQNAWTLARKYFDGSIRQDPCRVVELSVSPQGISARIETLRGLRYVLQSAPHPAGPYADLPDTSTTATDTRTLFPNAGVQTGEYFRVRLDL